ncbi:MAG: endolytic transglycosylase MltG [Candidatus Komeilibacteria bacterium]|nr:endolytic transglycosylase MltG [Candidatus Komeilibacteria bacterium]
MPRIILFIFGLAVIVAVIITGNFVWQLTCNVNIDETNRQLVIEPGMTVKQVTRVLTDKGIVQNDFWFRTYVWLRGAESKFMAGTFTLPANISSLGLFNLLTRIKPRPVRTVKVLEGWGIRDIAISFEYQGWWQQEELTELVGLPGVDNSLNADFYAGAAAEYPALKFKKPDKPLEGYLFPDTYQVFADAPIQDTVNKMLTNFESKVTADLRAEIERQGMDFYDVLIMASIIEAEVPHEADRAVVSDIFWSRLEQGVALQSDATLKYIIGGKRPALTSEELKMDSPYNTYKYRGLPPTPIGNPGLSAIKAAIYPAQTDYFYFLSTPEGQTIFSKTLDEHNRAKAKYLP